jgi:hypothetical protein
MNPLSEDFFQEFERVLTRWTRQWADREMLAAGEKVPARCGKKWAANLARARARDKAQCPQAGGDRATVTGLGVSINTQI